MSTCDKNVQKTTAMYCVHDDSWAFGDCTVSPPVQLQAGFTSTCTQQLCKNYGIVLRRSSVLKVFHTFAQQCGNEAVTAGGVQANMYPEFVCFNPYLTLTGVARAMLAV